MPTISAEAALLEKPDKTAVGFVAVSQGHGPAARRVFDADGGSKPAAGVTCRTH
ncbi:MAG TPA: hypothetical protein VJK90_15705 [Acetobacteraceae bacterium]|jgi:hypothetical protein|nr:hypothetical protein [Acetobacteraceae bacterium]